MLQNIIPIFASIIDSFKHLWPYLVATIPISVLVHLSGVSKHIGRVLNAKPIIAILLATAVGAFSPFCSCGVIPIIAALLTGGVPIAPVMSFWIASPLMDPEMFFLSVAVLGWPLAVWRLVSTLGISLFAGFVTHWVTKKGWLGEPVLRGRQWRPVSTKREMLVDVIGKVRGSLVFFFNRLGLVFPWIKWQAQSNTVCCEVTSFSQKPASNTQGGSCTSCHESDPISDQIEVRNLQKTSFVKKLMSETWKATFLILKFMLLAFFLKAVIDLLIPKVWIIKLLGQENPFSIVWAAVIGIPVYTSNLAALPMIGTLLDQGMNPAAALTFLLAGPTTTLPALAAVWGITSKRIFLLYVSFAFLGAIVFGVFYTVSFLM